MMLKQVQTSSTARQSASLAPRSAPALAARLHAAPSMYMGAASAPQRRRASVAVRAESSPPAKSAFAKVRAGAAAATAPLAMAHPCVLLLSLLTRPVRREGWVEVARLEGRPLQA
eukprot:353445-Chlamydomonas_euryale.AAC.28